MNSVNNCIIKGLALRKDYALYMGSAYPHIAQRSGTRCSFQSGLSFPVFQKLKQVRYFGEPA
jgi:hypothetical protein